MAYVLTEETIICPYCEARAEKIIWTCGCQQLIGCHADQNCEGFKKLFFSRYAHKCGQPGEPIEHRSGEFLKPKTA